MRRTRAWLPVLSAPGAPLSTPMARSGRRVPAIGLDIEGNRVYPGTIVRAVRLPVPARVARSTLSEVVRYSTSWTPRSAERPRVPRVEHVRQAPGELQQRR